jgi:hypothetical protein
MVLDIYNRFALESTVSELGFIAFGPVPDSLTNRLTPELLVLPQYLSSHAKTSLLSSVRIFSVAIPRGELTLVAT